MLWKTKPVKSERAVSREEKEFFTRVKGEITTIRQQGAQPEKDASTFSRFRCDLCNSTFPLQELRQCMLCGRWACPSCFTPDYYICNSCNGIVRLHLLSVKEEGKGRE